MERIDADASLLPALQLVSYIVIAIGASFMALRAGSVPASRWEPMSAGTFPQITFWAVVVLCGIAAASDLAKNGLPVTSLQTAWRHLVKLKSVMLNMILFCLYLFSMGWAGFIVSTFTYLLVAQWYLAPKRPWVLLTTVAVAALFSFGPYYLFSEIFSIYLPRARW